MKAWRGTHRVPFVTTWLLSIFIYSFQLCSCSKSALIGSRSSRSTSTLATSQGSFRRHRAQHDNIVHSPLQYVLAFRNKDSQVNANASTKTPTNVSRQVNHTEDSPVNATTSANTPTNVQREVNRSIAISSPGLANALLKTIAATVPISKPRVGAPDQTQHSVASQYNQTAHLNATSVIANHHGRPPKISTNISRSSPSAVTAALKSPSPHNLSGPNWHRSAHVKTATKTLGVQRDSHDAHQVKPVVVHELPHKLEDEGPRLDIALDEARVPPDIVAAVLNRVEDFQDGDPKWKKDPLGGWLPTPILVSQAESPIIEAHRSLGTEDIKYGFEGGKAVKDEDGVYWIFTAEMHRAPTNAGMRVAIWRSTGTNPRGTWQRHGTITESNQSFPLIYFAQQCNEPWCGWMGATKEHLTYVASYKCDPSDLLASPWAPIPVYDEEEGFWHVFLVGYQCDFSQLVACGTGNIFGARSTVPGKRGLGGPYELWSKGTDSIVLGPNATKMGKVWGDAHRGSEYVDQMSIFALGSGHGYAAFTGMSHNMATAPSVRGPWTVGESLRDAISTSTSDFNENSIVSLITAPTGKTIFGSVFDTVFRESHGFGFSYSKDGVHWGPQKGTDVSVPHGVRTPLGLLEEDDGTYTLFFTRRFPNCLDPVQLDNSGGFGVAYPSMCAHMYAATFAITWTNQLSKDELDSRDLAEYRSRIAKKDEEVRSVACSSLQIPILEFGLLHAIMGVHLVS